MAGNTQVRFASTIGLSGLSMKIWIENITRIGTTGPDIGQRGSMTGFS